MYNWVLKVAFIGASVAIVYFMRYGVPQKATYNAEQDAFPIQYLIGPCFLVGLVLNQDHYSPFEIIWAFSVYLEAVAILPQLFLLQKLGEVRPPCAATPPRHARALGAAPTLAPPLLCTGGEPDVSLRLCPRRVPRALPAQLDLQVHDRDGLRAADRLDSRRGANRPLLRLLLPLLRVQEGRIEQGRQAARLGDAAPSHRTHPSTRTPCRLPRR